MATKVVALAAHVSRLGALHPTDMHACCPLNCFDSMLHTCPSSPSPPPQDDSGKLSKFEIERRALGPKDVKVDIKFCGICHSDLVRGVWLK